MQFVDPNLVAIRTKVLDYFDAQREAFKPDHLLFNFETTMDVGNEVKLFEQVCYDMGFPSQNLPFYLTGENGQTELIDFYPELGYYRDTVFLFKFMMAPDVEVYLATTRTRTRTLCRYIFTYVCACLDTLCIGISRNPALDAGRRKAALEARPQEGQLHGVRIWR